ncbi:MAG TPA: type III polyketide synthase [Alphaproteobacteria bacterium]|jgi:alpha-pyrone synthase|nr:type III polyketide synthase [Alphaproteobacteria bacterium]
MRRAFINRIGRAVPAYDVHRKFVDFAPRLLADERAHRLFARMAERSQIEHRYSCLAPSDDPDVVDRDGFYARGAFPDTAQRMARYDRDALPLALAAVGDLGLAHHERSAITHLIVASCTGFVAPGLDLQLARELALPSGVERTCVGFMGCYAALPALKLARHIVRSEPDARVLVVALELCTLHLQESDNIDELLSFLLFADGAAAALVTAEPVGIEVLDFAATVLPDTERHITWKVGARGFDMHLSGQVPGAILKHLPRTLPDLLPGTGRQDIAVWAVHPGGRTILDAVDEGLELAPEALTHSRRILRDYGNMSSGTILFVLRDIMDAEARGPGCAQGCAMAFGPGVAIETMTFAVQ